MFLPPLTSLYQEPSTLVRSTEYVIPWLPCRGTDKPTRTLAASWEFSVQCLSSVQAETWLYDRWRQSLRSTVRWLMSTERHIEQRGDPPWNQLHRREGALPYHRRDQSPKHTASWSAYARGVLEIESTKKKGNPHQSKVSKMICSKISHLPAKINRRRMERGWLVVRYRPHLFWRQIDC